MGVPKQLTKDRSIEGEISRMLTAGEEVNIPGVGKLSVINKAARTARNPQTGASIQVPAKRVLKFSQSSVMTKALNG